MSAWQTTLKGTKVTKGATTATLADRVGPGSESGTGSVSGSELAIDPCCSPCVFLVYYFRFPAVIYAKWRAREHTLPCPATQSQFNSFFSLQPCSAARTFDVRARTLATAAGTAAATAAVEALSSFGFCHLHPDATFDHFGGTRRKGLPLDQLPRLHSLSLSVSLSLSPRSLSQRFGSCLLFCFGYCIHKSTHLQVRCKACVECKMQKGPRKPGACC